MYRRAHQVAPRAIGEDSDEFPGAMTEELRQLRAEIRNLRRSEQRFRDFAAMAGESIWFWETDRHHRFVHVSENFTAATGIRSDAQLGVGNEALTTAFAALTEDKSWPALRDLPFCLGDRGAYLLNAVPVFDESGSFAGYRGSARPAGGLTEAEKEAERTNRLFQEAIQEIACGFTIYDENDRLVTCNQSYRDIYATSADLIVPGRTFAEIVRHGAERGQYKAARGRIDEWVRERVAQHQEPAGRAIEQELDDGRWLLIVENRTPSGYIVGNRIEITERKRAEVEQQRLTRALRLATECIAAVVHADDEAGLLADICRKVVTTGGYALSWIGLACDDAEHSVQPVARHGDAAGYLDGIRISWRDDQELGRGLVGPAIFTGTPQVLQNFADAPNLAPWRERIAEYGFKSAAALPLVVNQRTIGALTLYANTTDAFSASEMELLNELAENLSFGIQSLRARRELEQHQRGLEQLVAVRTRQITELNHRLAERAKEAESASRAKSDFLATMSHEIRTPINAVLGLTEMLAQTSLNRRQQDYARKIQLSAQSLRALVDDVLDFSRIEAGALTLDQQPFSLNKVLQTVAMISSVSARNKAVEILFDLPPDLPDVLVGDSLRLQQILLNLANNAVKFTENGSIVLAARVVEHASGSVALELSVRDTGIGIPPEKLDQIFQVFTQADSSISRTYGGSGLGLAICARLAELMGGSISVTSQPGEGSEFRLSARWPLGKEQPTAIPPTLAGLRVLIVDDHALSRQLLAQTCTAFGWRGTEAASAREGILELQKAAAAGADYDLMLLDWRMPEVDGLQMLELARATPGLGLPLVVLMTPTHELEQAFSASENHSLDGLVAKPLTPGMLLEAACNAYAGHFPHQACPRHQFERKLAGLKLLVAEDNAINRELIEDILTRAGAEVVLANDGLGAVKALRSQGAHFDAVLMDIQMPFMDGYTATRVIRQELGLKDLPIIAVTAHAMAATIRQSREAGMNGLVLKPIDIDELLAVISVEGHAPETASVSPDAVLAPGLPGLAGDAVAHFGGDRRYLARLLQDFSRSHAGDMESVRAAFERGDHLDAARRIHQFGGAAAFLRATDVPRLARATEGTLLGDAPESAAPMLAELQAAMDVLLASIAEFDGVASMAGHSPPSPKALGRNSPLEADL